MAKRKKPEKPSVPEWVVTYGDMMSLLLCFFILLAAFSELKKPDEYQKVIDAIKEALGVDGGESVVFDPNNPTSLSDVIPQGVALRNETERTRADSDEQSTVGADASTATLFDARKWTIGKPLPFGPGEYELTEDNKHQLRDVIASKIHAGNRLFIVLGHAWGTEDRVSAMDPMDLSYERAKAVREFLVAECDVPAEMLMVQAAGASQPLSLEAGAAVGGTNRRVEVFMSNTPVSELHPDAAGTGRGG